MAELATECVCVYDDAEFYLFTENLDFIPFSGVIEFNQNTNATDQTVAVNLIDDNLFEDVEIFKISMELVSGQAVLHPNMTSVNMTDNDGKMI